MTGQVLFTQRYPENMRILLLIINIVIIIKNLLFYFFGFLDYDYFLELIE